MFFQDVIFFILLTSYGTQAVFSTLRTSRFSRTPYHVHNFLSCSRLFERISTHESHKFNSIPFGVDIFEDTSLLSEPRSKYASKQKTHLHASVRDDKENIQHTPDQSTQKMSIATAMMSRPCQREQACSNIMTDSVARFEITTRKSKSSPIHKSAGPQEQQLNEEHHPFSPHELSPVQNFEEFRMPPFDCSNLSLPRPSEDYRDSCSPSKVHGRKRPARRHVRSTYTLDGSAEEVHTLMDDLDRPQSRRQRRGRNQALGSQQFEEILLDVFF
jgi:hypothetical protein